MTDPRSFDTVEALEACVGEELGVSDWIEMSQSRILRFADATDDRQWIHLDEVRAEAESPYGTTVAHGYLTLSMLPRITAEVFTLKPRVAGINYGLDKVRFLAPVPSDSRIRGRVVLDRVLRQKPDTIRVHLTVTVEIEGGDKPACVAEAIALYIVAP
ncbi:MULTISPECIES: MaoC family dehydratase [Thalassobaculum]|uniref:Acyl dehydratase n=1 Tax=Thalassobaculum litoreum DSM 18839 TaxID=1123362 RepID=A0A8G2EWL2_9PROT|nr:MULTISPECIES: MaoC family dehydratase [Thalassobaculum]SDF04620.1 Acyl dehydratase [Thalassobaculum litoreum DSM 18839]